MDDSYGVCSSLLLHFHFWKVGVVEITKTGTLENILEWSFKDKPFKLIVTHLTHAL